nr:glycosyltransferase family A protein [Shimia biformata]
MVIPVRNDQDRLCRVLRQAAGLGIFDQVVIVDDGSEPPAHADGCGFDTGPEEAQVVILRQDSPAGAGAARNRAIAHVTTSHLLFFDSDDQLTRDLGALWQELQGKPFDFCLFRHHDSRSQRRGIWGQMALDNALWRQAGAGHATLFTPARGALAALAETANYPWNKIYRTGFLRDHPDVRCSPTPLHNDIRLHWMSFLHADTVLASDRVAAIHEVREGGGRMTNRTSAERLCVFEPLTEVAAALADAPDAAGPPGLGDAFITFAAGLLDWVRSALDAAHHPALDQATRAFWQTHMDPPLFDRISRRDPVLALRLCLQMAGGDSAGDSGNNGGDDSRRALTC